VNQLGEVELGEIYSFNKIEKYDVIDVIDVVDVVDDSHDFQFINYFSLMFSECLWK